MVTNISAEFDNVETAELAAGKIRRDIDGVYSAKVTGKGISSGGTLVSVIPTYANNFSMNFMTAVTESPAADSVKPEPEMRSHAAAYIVCDGSGVDEINAVLNSYGAVNIRSNFHSVLK
ncbi:MAG: hypothetical protein IJ874_08025 [Ruminococcus sp.]|nr:hypothetical protein [Ruminococcus sp.]